jgi:hypothetical protein
MRGVVRRLVGNSRPIFTDGRIFALSGTEIIEGRVAGGRIEEIDRVNLTAPPPPLPKAPAAGL